LPGQRSLPIGAFAVDRDLVTNEDFLAFTREYPEWSFERVNPTLVDEQYLSYWVSGPGPYRTPPQTLRAAPVTSVSWFAARAFCEQKGGRLPTMLEWEYMAAANDRGPNGAQDAALADRILNWYAHPFRLEELARPRGTPNFYGVRQLYDWVWEWVEDFNSVFLPGDAVACGSGGVGAARRSDYAAFMRYALRSSLDARFSLVNLGFRCAYDDGGPQ
jgi:formylglycine-generating enzyme required for sulfatase activity